MPGEANRALCKETMPDAANRRHNEIGHQKTHARVSMKQNEALRSGRKLCTTTTKQAQQSFALENNTMENGGQTGATTNLSINRLRQLLPCWVINRPLLREVPGGMGRASSSRRRQAAAMMPPVCNGKDRGSFQHVKCNKHTDVHACWAESLK